VDRRRGWFQKEGREALTLQGSSARKKKRGNWRVKRPKEKLLGRKSAGRDSSLLPKTFIEASVVTEWGKGGKPPGECIVTSQERSRPPFLQRGVIRVNKKGRGDSFLVSSLFGKGVHLMSQNPGRGQRKDDVFGSKERAISPSSRIPQADPRGKGKGSHGPDRPPSSQKKINTAINKREGPPALLRIDRKSTCQDRRAKKRKKSRPSTYAGSLARGGVKEEKPVGIFKDSSAGRTKKKRGVVSACQK